MSAERQPPVFSDPFSRQVFPFGEHHPLSVVGVDLLGVPLRPEQLQHPCILPLPLPPLLVQLYQLSSPFPAPVKAGVPAPYRRVSFQLPSVVPDPRLVVVAQPSPHLLVHLLVDVKGRWGPFFDELDFWFVLLEDMGTLVWVPWYLVFQCPFGGSVRSSRSLGKRIERWLLLLLCGLVG